MTVGVGVAVALGSGVLGGVGVAVGVGVGVTVSVGVAVAVGSGVLGGVGVAVGVREEGRDAGIVRVTSGVGTGTSDSLLWEQAANAANASSAVVNQQKWDRSGPEKVIVMRS